MRYSYNGIDIDKNIDEIINDYCHELDIIDFEFICEQSSKQIKKDGLYDIKICNGVGNSVSVLINDEHGRCHKTYLVIDDYNYKDVKGTFQIFWHELSIYNTASYYFIHMHPEVLPYLDNIIKEPLNTVVMYKKNEFELKYKFYKEIRR